VSARIQSLIVLTLIAPACAAPMADEPAGATHSAIVAGWDDDGDPAVVALMRAGSVTCSGTLIGPNVVLTAAHCVELLTPEWIVFGADPAAPVERVSVSAVQIHPGYNRPTLAHDIAVLILERPVDVTPVELPSYELGEASAGEQIRLVGFGVPGRGVEATLRKRQGFSRISGFEIDRFSVDGDPAQPCLGDSGGPAFMRVGDREPIVGVHSGGSAECTGGSYEARVGAHLPFIEAHLTTPYARPDAYAGLSGTCAVAASGRAASGHTAPWGLIAGVFALLSRRRRR